MSQPLTMKLHDAGVEHLIGSYLDCEVLSTDGRFRLRVVRERATKEGGALRVWLNFEDVGSSALVNATMLDKAQAKVAREALFRTLSSLKPTEDVVLNRSSSMGGARFRAREIQTVIRSLTRFIDGS